MMLFIGGIVTAIAFIGMMGVSYWLGTKRAHRVILEPVAVEKQKKAEEQAEAMQKILNYDIGMAYKARREGVTK